MSLSELAVGKINLGPCVVTFGGVELGRTQGVTAFNFTNEYHTEATEEDGEIMDILVNHRGEVSIPLVYTDPDTLAEIMPWATVEEDTSGKKLVVGDAIGNVMNDYVDELIIHPLAKDPADKSADITLGAAYPMPQTLELGHARTGKRLANAMFKAQKDVNGNYFTIGDTDIGATPVISTTHTIAVGADDPAIVLKLRGDDFAATADAENTANWEYNGGATTLTLESVHKTGPREAVVVLNAGTGATAGTISIQAKAEALAGIAASNVLSITLTT